VWCGVIDTYIKVKKGLNPTNFLALVIGIEKKLIPSDVIGGVNAGLSMCKNSLQYSGGQKPLQYPYLSYSDNNLVLLQSFSYTKNMF
jgi:hypothetical protein